MPYQPKKINMIMPKKELEEAYLNAGVDYISGKIDNHF